MSMPPRELAEFKRLNEALGAALAAGEEVRGVEAVPGRCGGRPTIVGSRIEVITVWVNFLEGRSLQELSLWWPSVTEKELADAIRALRPAVRYAKRAARRTRRAA